MAQVEYSKVRKAAQAQPLAAKLLGRVGAADAAAVESALAAAAVQNGDRYLSAGEAKRVQDAFEQSSGSQTSALSGPALAKALEVAKVSVEALASATNVDGLSVHFSGQESLEAKLIQELYAAVDRAGGRPVDVNMMIFEFQSDEVTAAILDIAQTHPEVMFRVIADSGQASGTGGNALPELLAKKLPNLQVKFKADFPYVWDEAGGKPAYNHGASKGLNHHKGFATFIDGMPDRLLAGSFNWSDTADEKNYEDLVVVHASDAATRRAVTQYQDEFLGFFNDNVASLSPNRFSNFKRDQTNALRAAHGKSPLGSQPKPDDTYAPYVPAADVHSFDVNGFTSQDKQRLTSLVGAQVAKGIASERTKFGRFASFDELTERVPGVAALPQNVQDRLLKEMTFGSGTVSVNAGSVEELDGVGLSLAAARKLVDWRELHGDLESVEAAAQIPGVTAKMLSAAGASLTDDDLEAFFNSRAFGAPAAGTGYGAQSSVRTTPVMQPSGTVARVPASVTAAVNDLFYRAQPGQQLCVAMYSMSPGSKEFAALSDAAKRGLTVRVVLNADLNATAVAALKKLRDQGFAVDVRVQSAKTMHEKFAVAGDDVVFGSANFSESSSTKHSEDRWAVKNSAEVSAAFQGQFERLWAKSRVVQ